MQRILVSFFHFIHLIFLFLWQFLVNFSLFLYLIGNSYQTICLRIKWKILNIGIRYWRLIAAVFITTMNDNIRRKTPLIFVCLSLFGFCYFLCRMWFFRIESNLSVYANDFQVKRMTFSFTIKKKQCAFILIIWTISREAIELNWLKCWKESLLLIMHVRKSYG